MFVFQKNLACFVVLKHSFWDSPFCLITDIIYTTRNSVVLDLDFLSIACHRVTAKS